MTCTALLGVGLERGARSADNDNLRGQFYIIIHFPKILLQLFQYRNEQQQQKGAQYKIL